MTFMKENLVCDIIVNIVSAVLSERELTTICNSRDHSTIFFLLGGNISEFNALLLL